MWIEAIFANEDFVRLVNQLLPVSIVLNDGGDHISLHDPGVVSLVPDRGVRVTCKASVRWTIIGIHVPITLHTVQVLLRPEIVKHEGGKDTLVMRLVIEDADLAGVPAFLDEKIRHKVNDVMKTKHVQLTWDFGEMLTRSVGLPATLQPLQSLALEVAWGKVKVTDEAMVLAISFHSHLSREPYLAPPSVRPAAPLRVVDPPAIAALAETPTATPLVLGGAVLALALSGAYGAMRVTSPSRRNGSLLSTIASVAITSAVVAVGGQVATQLVRSLLAPRDLRASS
jgi:hypothetical protein